MVHTQASGGVGIQVMAEIYQVVLDGFVMPVEWVVFRNNLDFMNTLVLWHQSAGLVHHSGGTHTGL